MTLRILQEKKQRSDDLLVYIQHKRYSNPTPAKKKKTRQPEKIMGIFSWNQGHKLPFHPDPGLSFGFSTQPPARFLRPLLPKGGHCRAALGEGVNERHVWETDSISTPSKGSLSPNH